MLNRTVLTAGALGCLAIACGRNPTGVHEDQAPGLGGASAEALTLASERGVMDRLARRLARALADSAFRAYVRAELIRSPFIENKLHLQSFLQRSNRHALRQVSRLTGETEAALETDARAAIPLELYFPVVAHRSAWTGGPDLLVATAREDHEAPVAYDVKGRRRQLRADAPPTTPVLALVPAEIDFGPEDAIGLAITPPPPPPPPLPAPPPPAGLFMTSAHFVQDFEGWFKGNPEFEVHILGQSGSSDSLTDYQCSGAAAQTGYRFDQNGLDWSGSVQLFSQAQLDSYKAAHPKQNFRIVALEDDDTACRIKFDANRFRNLQTVLQAAYPDLTGTKDTTAGLGKIVKRANAIQKILTAAYSFITTQDDLIGNAIEDVVAGRSIPGANWIVKGDNNATNGWLKLEVR